MTATAEDTGTTIKPGDVALVRLGATYTKRTIKSARRLIGALGLDMEGAETLENQVGAVLDAIKQRALAAKEKGVEEEAEIKGPLVIAPHLVRAARIGVGLYFNKVSTEQETLGELMIEDTTGIDNKVKQCERLLKHLGGKLELPLEENDEDEDDEE